jgi:hypothetical protein
MHKIISDRVMCSACQAILPKARALLDGIQPEIDSLIMEGKQPLARNEQPFEAARALARLILGQIWLREGQRLPGESFLINLESLFERTITKAFAEAGVKSKPNEPVRYARIENLDQNAKTVSASMFIDLFLPDLPEGPVVVDSKYKTEVSSANLQQMVTYCFSKGARRAVLVFPEGYPSGYERKQSRVFESPIFKTTGMESQIRIDTVQLGTGATDLQGWRSAASKLVREVLN